MDVFLVEFPRDGNDARQADVRALAAQCGVYGRVMLTPFRYDFPAENNAAARVAEFLAGAQRVFVLGFQFPRAQQWTLEAWGIHFSDMPAEAVFLDVRAEDFSLADVMRAHGVTPAAEAAEPEELAEKLTPRWYPVVDAARCVNCLECLNFCLFGVYSTDTEGRLFVETPDACRPGCPACARVCPQKAIIFPMCEEEEIAGKTDSLDDLVAEVDELE